MDLQQAILGNEITARRFRVLASALPGDSSFQAFLRDTKSRDLVDTTISAGMSAWLS